jgi:nucleoid-associated protein YgaU
MNRQVGPSILLSVAIVCFFAVALYQHDPPQSRDVGSRSRSADAIARSGSAPEKDTIRSGSGRADKAADAHSVPAQHESKPQIITTGASPPSRTNLKRPPTRVVRQGASGRIGSYEATNLRPTDRAQRPAAPFTIVEADETLEDVARRIYGSSIHVDSLWRANRDNLSQRNAPLAAGTVLRTPTLR